MAQFKPGQSGNPSGKPKGSKLKTTRLRALLEKDSDALIMKAAEMAKPGDTTALRLCLERILPAIKSESRPVYLPRFAAAETLADQGRAVLAEVAVGALAPDQAASLLGALTSQARLVETSELQARIAALEAGREA